MYSRCLAQRLCHRRELYLKRSLTITPRIRMERRWAKEQWNRCSYSKETDEYAYVSVAERLQQALAVGNADQTMNRLYLVDAMDPINRIHYAYRDRLYSQSGQDTTILYGFMKQLLALLNTKPRPSHCIVVIDAPGADFREVIYPGYKAQREETPTEIVQSIPLIQTALQLLRVKCLRVHAVEADDVIGTMAERFTNDFVTTYIFSRDKDFFQLVRQNVVLIRGPMRDGRFLHYTEKAFRNEFGIDSSLWIEVLALQGDPSDNIPGVRQIGPKRALQLVADYGRIENVFAHAAQITSNVIRKSLTSPTAKNDALLSRKLATIVTDLNLPPLRFDLEDATVKPSDKDCKRFLTFMHDMGITTLDMDTLQYAYGQS